MDDGKRASSPLESVAGTADVAAAEAFGVLASETRLAILLALWEAYDPHAADVPVPFSELRERVGDVDSGKFNYHLKKLVGEFVGRTDEGYVLRPLGLELVQTVVAGAGRPGALDPTGIDVACNLCGGGTAMAYRDGWLYHVCTECDGGISGYGDGGDLGGILFAEPFPPAALEGRTPEELFAAGVFRLLQVLTMKVGGVCPRCSGVVESSLSVCEDHETVPGEVCDACGNARGVRVTWVCSVCKYRGGSSPGPVVGLHPAFVAFYHEHGVDLGYPASDFESTRRVLDLLRAHEEELLSTDPLRLRVTARCDGDELALTFDESLALVDDAGGA